MKKTSLIILTRNEFSGVKTLLGKIPFKAVDEAFVVDYKSSDGTVEFLEKKGVKVIHQEVPGRAEAFRVGVRKAKGDFLIFFSPDGNENPADILKIKKYLNEGYDMVIASRFMNKSRNEEDESVFKFRAWANRTFTFLVRLFWGGNITDTINGYRGVTRQAFNKMKIDAVGFVVEYQMTIRALKLGLSIKEFPTIEGDRIGGESKAKAIPTGLTFLKFLIREVVLGKSF